MTEEQPRVSVVVPIFNEEDSIEELHARVVKTLEARGDLFELIAVDDGSTDRSLAMLKGLREQDPRVRVLRLTRNFGQSPALYAGFSRARGEYVIMLDADLQNYPEDIPKLLDRLEEGYDVVSGWRTQRHDTLFRRMASRLLNAWIARITGLKLHDYGCGLKGFRRHLVDNMNTLTHRCRYLPADIAAIGGAVAEVPIQHARRTHGQSRYNLLKLVRLSFDIFTGITLAPLQIIGMLGTVLVFGGVGLGVYATLLAVVHGAVSDLAVILAFLFFLSGIQMIATGLISEYIGRIYVEAQHKPFFVVHEEIQ